MKFNTNLCLFFAVFIILIGNSFAFEFDNVKSYDSVNKEITISNSFLGVPSSDVAKITLDTPQINYVMKGKDRKVAEFTIDLYEDNYADFLKGIELKNNLNGKIIDRVIVLKSKSEKNYEIEIFDTKNECYEAINKSIICSNKVIGSHKEIRKLEVWTPIEKQNLIKGKITIGIFTDVYENDNIEWYPTLFGVKITEWATWINSLNVGLVRYYSFEETSGTATEMVFGIRNLTNGEGCVQGVSGIIGNAYNYTTDSNSYSEDLTGQIGMPLGSSDRTINFWIYNYENPPDYSIPFFYGDNTGTGTTWRQRFLTTPKISLSGNGADLDNIVDIVNGSWHMLTMGFNATGIFTYYDGIYISAVYQAINTDAGNACLMIGGENGYCEAWASSSWGGKIDELGIWNRTLSNAEIIDLFNSGNGITYSNVMGQIIINSPLNITYNNNDIIHNVTFALNGRCLFSYGGGIINYTMSSPDNQNWNGTLTDLSEGDHNVTFYCNDSAGNWFMNDTIYSVDTIAPFVTINSPSDIYYNDATIIYNVTTNENSYCVFNDGSGNFSMSSPDNKHFNLTKDVLAEGFFIAMFYCNDSAGNMRSNFTNYKVDTTAPNATLIYPIGLNVANTTINLIINLTDNVQLRNITTIIINSSGYETKISSNYAGTINQSNQIVSLAVGNYRWYVILQDQAGNIFDGQNYNVTFNAIATIIPLSPIIYSPIYQAMESSGAGLAVFIEYMNKGFPILLLGLMLVAIFVIIGSGIKILIKKFAHSHK